MTTETSNARGGVRGLVEVLRNLCSWKHLMSYNEAYFGEPEGELKSVVYAIERHLPSLAAEGVQAEEVGQRARELLAAEYEQSGLAGLADEARMLRANGTNPAVSTDAAVRAIARALSQQPEGMCEKGQAFKDYVHGRLNSMEVPHSVPESEHDKAGCRIGGRLDWVESRMAEARGVVDALALVVGSVKWDQSDAVSVEAMRRAQAALTGERNG